ncbi:hypothetical protein COCCADRAFT_96459 [Bipolaris zeicola 26-R-13]|uniref:Uncharacterized protein n=1 Tax=Cochliobolus carbonum (strain 26-R-13) TaxID=930089 RepID=W6YCR5_COCC2|nr:uncharacterized protein COCCADRAFT_96459 [Bipolaris zeicola 26-R-13]EUC33309.1 hypothetical protein COCCADRAFT_96459 [Bipolaris zeicola 26-R-13]
MKEHWYFNTCSPWLLVACPRAPHCLARQAWLGERERVPPREPHNMCLGLHERLLLLLST